MNNDTRQVRSTENRNRILTTAKYVILAAIAVFIAGCVYTQHQGNVPLEEVRAAVEQAIDQETMTDAGNKGFTRFYGLNSSDYDGVLLYQSASGMSADEILLVKVKDREQLEPLTESINGRRSARISDFSGYAPEEEAIMEEAELIVKGNYVLFLPYSQADDVKQAFLTALGV